MNEPLYLYHPQERFVEEEGEIHERENFVHLGDSELERVDILYCPLFMRFCIMKS